jgi:hypothetical protein
MDERREEKGRKGKEKEKGTTKTSPREQRRRENVKW